MTSFEFAWNKAPKSATGKVFARKKKPASGDGKTPTTTQVSFINPTPEKAKFKKSKTSSEIPKDKITPVESNNEVVSTSLIKRKGKKDKLAAKAQGQSVLPQNKSDHLGHSLFSEKHKNVYVNTAGKGKSVVEKVFSAGKEFSDLDIHKYIVSNLKKLNFTTLTNVQEKSIPVILEGKNVLIRSQTGSGKTLAYAVPILNKLQSRTPRLQRSDGVQAIIVVPTRELALQTHELFQKINTFQWIVAGYLCGGENRNTEKTRLRKGVHILIATPGRLLDHMLHTSSFKTEGVKYLVLDEADRLLDMGFKKDIVKIVEQLDSSKTNSEYDPMALLKGQSNTHSDKPEAGDSERQTLLLSATLSKGIAELADFTMKNHEYVDALAEYSDINPDHMVIPNTVKQEFILTYVKPKLVTLSSLLIAKSKQNAKVFVFMATSQMVDYHYELFSKYLVRMPINRGKLKSGNVVLLEDAADDSDDEIEVLDVQFFKLHGSMEQHKRKEVFTGFRAAKKGILLCTDVVARGIDVPTADCIIQYTGPQSDDDYIHRVGRTGRAGKTGSAIIFLTHEEQEYISRLQEHKVFLKEHKADDCLKFLCDIMDEPDQQKAAQALQRRYEDALAKDKELQKLACFAYSSWSRYYSSFPAKLRHIFDFKNVNLGHYVSSFGLRNTPTEIAKFVRGQVATLEPPKLNKKLATHDDGEKPKSKLQQQKRKIKSISLTTSEFSSGLEPKRKKKKPNK